MLRADAISVRIDSRWILYKLSLSVPPGRVVAVVGPNGAGKSTLMRALSGEIALDDGCVTMNNLPLNAITLRERAQVRAVLPQDSSLSFPFRAAEVVMMGRGPTQGAGVRQDWRIVIEALAAADAAHLAERDYTTLSGGERQRVQLARVLAQIWEPQAGRPRYLLLDEPTSALDLAHQHHCLGVAHRLASEQGVGVLAILHDLNLAACYADEIVILSEGCLIARGAPHEVLEASRIEETFGIKVAVLDHPLLVNRPLIVTTNSALGSAPASTPFHPPARSLKSVIVT